MEVKGTASTSKDVIVNLGLQEHLWRTVAFCWCIIDYQRETEQQNTSKIGEGALDLEIWVNYSANKDTGERPAGLLLCNVHWCNTGSRNVASIIAWL